MTLVVDAFSYINAGALSWHWSVYVHGSRKGLEMLGCVVCVLMCFVLFRVSLPPCFVQVLLAVV